MDSETNNVRRLEVSKGLLVRSTAISSRPRYIVSARKFESDTLIKHKARLVARGCI